MLGVPNGSGCTDTASGPTGSDPALRISPVENAGTTIEAPGFGSTVAPAAAWSCLDAA